MAHHRGRHRRSARPVFNPGRDPMGWIVTILLGIGSLLLAGLIFDGFWQFVIGVIVAIVLVSLYGRFMRPCSDRALAHRVDFEGSRPRGKRRTAVSPQSSSRQMCTRDRGSSVRSRRRGSRASPRRFGRLAEAGRDRDDDRADVAVRHLELAALADGGLGGCGRRGSARRPSRRASRARGCGRRPASSSSATARRPGGGGRRRS